MRLHRRSYHRYHHHHHYHNHRERIHLTGPLVSDETSNQVELWSMYQVSPMSTDQINTSYPPIKATHPADISFYGFLSLLIICPLLVSNVMALKIIVIVKYSSVVSAFLIASYNHKFCPDCWSVWRTYDAPKDIKPWSEAEGFVLFLIINLAAIIAALLIENLWILKLLSMFAPLALLLGCLQGRKQEFHHGRTCKKL